MLLNGKIALITGAATGIGRTCAFRFAEEGAKVIIADINKEDGVKTVAEIKEKGNEAVFLQVDLGSVSQIEQMIKKSVKLYGRIDILWHNAGISFPGHIEQTTEELFDKQVAINLKAAVFSAQYALAEMKKTGGGSILFTGSTVGLKPIAYSPAYSLTYGLTKAGLVMLVRYLAVPLGRYNIRVNCICPGPVITPRITELRKLRAKEQGVSLEKVIQDSNARIPLGKEMSMDEIADAALFLVSDRASAITGIALPVDGGSAAI